MLLTKKKDMKKMILTLQAFLILLILSSCNKNNDNLDNGTLTGKIIVRITDDPFDINLIESASVTITKIELRKINDSTDNKYIVLMEDTITVDLMNLRNGITEELVNIEVPVGEYDLIRIYVDQASLVLKEDLLTYTIKVPSGHQTGIKIFICPSIIVSGELTSELLLDFDLSKSFVLRGNSGHGHSERFIFKPVIRASNLSTSGSIEGIVTDTANQKISAAKVWISQDTTIATAFSDTLGFYAFIGIPEGSYSLYAVSENFDTAFFEGIIVNAGNKTIQNIVLQNQ